MKKLLLTISALLVAFSVKAQDVYLSGTAMDENENLIAVVYRNGELLYRGQSIDEHFGYGVVVNPYDHDDVFWLEEYYEAGDRVSLIHRGNGNYLAIYDAVVGKMFWCNSGDNNSDQDLLSVGYRDGSDNNHYAAVWRGLDLYLSPDFNDGRESAAMSVVAFPGPSGEPVVYYGGSREDAGGQYEQATVWKNDAVLYTLTDPGVSGLVTSLDYYDGTLYSLVFEVDSEGAASLNLYENQNLTFTAIDGTAVNYTSVVKVDDGDVYIYAFCDVNSEGVGVTKVWKNGNLIYSHEGVYFDVYDTNCMDVTSDGVYYMGMEYDEAQGLCNYYVFHNDEIIETFDYTNFVYVTGMQVVMECHDDAAREMPYLESFDDGVTDWECWTVLDEYENYYDDNQSRPSYWHRSAGHNGVSPTNGDHLAYYKWNDGATQEGWLISPKLAITDGGMTLLSFQTYEEYFNEMDYEGVWVSTTNTNPSSFTEVWAQDNPYNDWREVDIDLTAYGGQEIYVAFKYAGFDGHSWYLDDVRVVNMPLPPGPSDVPEIYDENSRPCLVVCQDGQVVIMKDGKKYNINGQELRK